MSKISDGYCLVVVVVVWSLASIISATLRRNKGYERRHPDQIRGDFDNCAILGKKLLSKPGTF